MWVLKGGNAISFSISWADILGFVFLKIHTDKTFHVLVDLKYSMSFFISIIKHIIYKFSFSFGTQVVNVSFVVCTVLLVEWFFNQTTFNI